MPERPLLPGASLEGLPESGRLVVGYSGGADSTALAHWLMGQVPRERILLAHVNHMLRGAEADRDQAFAQAFAKSQGLAIQVLREDVAKLARDRGQGLEECGREVRYGFFHRLASGEQDRILTAHNADDNAETLLLNLCRGAALEGLCGIPRQRGKLLRPLLDVERKAVEAYCQAQGLAFVTDSSNFSDAFARNRVRRPSAAGQGAESLGPGSLLFAGRAGGSGAPGAEALFRRGWLRLLGKEASGPGLGRAGARRPPGPARGNRPYLRPRRAVGRVRGFAGAL